MCHAVTNGPAALKGESATNRAGWLWHCATGPEADVVPRSQGKARA